MMKKHFDLNKLEQIAKETELDLADVKQAWYSCWEFIRKTISNTELKDIDINKFKTLRTSFNLPYFGKLHCTEKEFIKANKKYNNIKDGNKES